MNRRLKKLIEEKAWETLTDYGYNDSQLLEQLTEAVLQRLNEQVVAKPNVGNPLTSNIPTKSKSSVRPPQEYLDKAAMTSSLREIEPPPGAGPGQWYWDNRGLYYKEFGGPPDFKVYYWYGDPIRRHNSPPYPKLPG
tara:strand:- start:37 stop:447 length:411 start_codon:yes stop_codon:yes gene_type:complete